METYDVAIVGAGVIGAAIARELSQWELRILWLEKARDVAMGVTKGNTSIIHGGFDDAKTSVKARYSPRGAAMVQNLDQYLHFGFRKCGSLVVAFSESERPRLEALLANGQANGVRGLEIWSKSELREREPQIHPDAACALYASESGVVIAPEFCIALAENAVANGVDLHLGEKLVDLEADAQVLDHSGNFGPGYRLNSGSYRCRYLVNAAGWGAPAISEMLHTERPDWQLQAVKGQYLVLDRSCGDLARHVLFPLPDKTKGKGTTVCPTYHGNLLLGPDAEFVEDPYDLSTQFDKLQNIFRRAQQLVPALPRNKIIRSYAGMRPRLVANGQTKAGDFLIRSRKAYCELLGIASPGLTAALPLAQEVAQKVTHTLGMNQFRANHPAIKGPEIPLRRHFVRERKPYIGSQRDKRFISGKDIPQYTKLPLLDPNCLICRCEQVRSEVIQELLRRPKIFHAFQAFGATESLEFIKWRSRAGMGFCQGRFCGPRLRELLGQLRGTQQTNIRPRSEAPERVAPETLRRSL